MSHWKIELFGQLRVWQDGTELKAFQHRRIGSLFSYLACRTPRWENRTQLAALLWPDSSTEDALLSLRVALSRIRKRLGGKEIVQREGERLRLNPELVEVDIAQFEKAISLGDWQSAIGLYTAPLLPHYDDLWLGAERQRLADHFLYALRELTEQARATGSWDAAIEYARQAVEADIFREDSHQKLLALYSEAGRPAAAQTHYKELERLFREELSIAPSAETRALLSATPARTAAPKVAAPAKPQKQDPAILERRDTSLPYMRTRFLGREAELARLHGLLEERGALVVLTGMGGMGKTRLAVEAARELASPIAVFWVPLMDVRKTDDLWDVLQRYISQQARPEGSETTNKASKEQVLELLGSAPALVLLDNAEHLDPGVVQGLIETLLTELVDLRVLVTSRRRLGLPGEQVFALGALPPEQSRELFIDRARHLRSAFTLSHKSEEAVVGICASLEGMPLAIEMAAGRISIMTPDQIMARLKDRFALLSSTHKDTPTRHRTLNALLDWSYNLLSEQEQEFMGLLTVFRGGWSIEAAEAISQAPHALEYTQELVDASLLQTGEIETPEGETAVRFYLLETTRQFLEHRVRPEMLQAARQALIGWCIAYLEAMPEKNSPASLRAFLIEQENLREALHLALVERLDISAGIKLTYLSWASWQSLGEDAEAIHWLELALQNIDSVPPDEKVFATLVDVYATFIANSGKRGKLEEALSRFAPVFERIEDPAARGAIEQSLGTACMIAGDMPRAREYFRSAHALQGELPNYSGRPLMNLISTYQGEHNWEEVRRYAHIGLGLPCAQSGRTRAVFLCLAGVGEGELGELEAAKEHQDEALQIVRDLGETGTILQVSSFRAALANRCQDWDKALEIYREIGPMAHAAGSRTTVKRCLSGLIIIAQELGQLRRVLRLLGGYETYTSEGWKATQANLDENSEIRQEVEERLGGDLYGDVEVGRKMPESDFIAFAFQAVDVPLPADAPVAA